MDKNKIINTYLDFIQGKFMKPSDRLDFNNIEKKAKKLIDETSDFYSLGIQKEDIFSNDAFIGLSEFVIKAQGNNENPKEIMAVAKYSSMNNYYKIFSEKKYHVNSENIYCTSNKIFNYFLNIPLPDKFHEIDYLFTKDLPALFVFESGEVCYLKYINNYQNIPELTLIIFGDDSSFKYSPNYIVFDKDFLFNSFQNDYYSSHLSSEVLAQEMPYIEKFKKLIHFFCNLLLFLKIKDTMSLVTDELNPVIVEAQKNIDNNKNIGRNTQILNNTKSYKFIDLDLTLSEYSKQYKERNPESYTSSKAPHWRTGHYQSYWTGKRDGSEEKKRTIKFIPTLWVGDPSLMQEQTIFKIIK